METEVQAPVADEARDTLVASLADALGDALVGSEVRSGVDVWARVDAAAWLETARVLKSRCGMSYFNFLSAIDWLPSPYGRDMDAQVDQPEPREAEDMTWGVTGGSSRFQLLARVHDPVGHVGITVKADLDGDAPEVDSWIPVYGGADWHEREAWEMFGITFRGHPNLIHIYLPSGFEGTPLRKDYPLLARRVKPWPGIVDVELLPGDEAGEGDEAGDEDAS